MKYKYVLLILAALGLLLVLNQPHAQAEEQIYLYPISLDEVKQKMADKESFYLYVGREDSVPSQKSKAVLSKWLEKDGPKVFYLDTRRIDYVAYRKFARRYKIRSNAHLAFFKAKKQIRFLSNFYEEAADLLPSFFEEGK